MPKMTCRVTTTTFPLLTLVLLLGLVSLSDALQRPLILSATIKQVSNTVARRSFLVFAPTAALVVVAGNPVDAAAAANNNGLVLTTTPSGLRWADAKVGTGSALRVGGTAAIDYAMATTGGRNARIYSTKDSESQPYRWVLGDGSTIAGLERAILGNVDDGIPPMLPGGIRRVFLPSNLAYEALAVPRAKCDGTRLGPIPPNDDGAFQRFKQVYCNPRIPYQPDVVLDIKLYGKRT